MFADDGAFGIDDFAGDGDIGAAFGDEICVGAFADEADFLALGFLSDGQAEATRKGADFGFGQSAEREADEAELVLVHGVEDVALVFLGVNGAEETVWFAGEWIAERDAGVVTGGEAIGTEEAGAVDEMAEFDVAVALQTGVGGATGGVFVDEAVDDGLTELCFHIDGVERDADQGAGGASIVHGGDTAAGIDGVFGIGGREEAEVHADDAVAAFAHDQGGGGAIDAAAHGDDDGFSGTITRADLLLAEQVVEIGIGRCGKIRERCEWSGDCRHWVLV